MGSFDLKWSPRQHPLSVEGLVASGEVALNLARKLLRRPAFLRGVRADNRLVLLGSPDQLPWCEGLVYLGRADTRSSLYLPIHLSPSLPLEWLSQALHRHCPPPWVLLPDNRVIGLALASAVDAPLLRLFLEQVEAKVEGPST